MTPAQVTRRLMIDNPFYGFVLMSLDKTFDRRGPRAGIRVRNLGYDLSINPDFWEKCSDEQQVQTIQHELIHACLFHLTDREGCPDKRLWNTACDAEVNQYLDVETLKTVPDGGCVDIFEVFPTVKPKAGARYYYNYLKDLGFENLNNGDYPFQDTEDHWGWSDCDDMSDSEKEVLKDRFDYILKEAANYSEKCCGHIPGEMVEYISKISVYRPPVYNWRNCLRRMLGNADETFRVSTYKRPSKRFRDSKGTKLRHKGKILVGMDTSGSVDSNELSEFLLELDFIKRAGIAVDLAECDTGIHRIIPYDNTFDNRIHGRGGTSFRPVVDYYNEHRDEYSTLVYFTDGYGSLNFTVNGPSIWVITSEGKRQRYPGKAVYIPKKKQEEQK